MNLFNDEELKYLPVNCALYSLNENKETITNENSLSKIVDSEYHQNKQMEIVGNFYKSITRMIIIKYE